MQRPIHPIESYSIGIICALGIEKASLVGNSFGGALSLGLATFDPSRVERLVLLGTPAGEFEQTCRGAA